MASQDFMTEFLETHNAYRALHKAPPLTYNSQLNFESQKWADHCLELNTLAHSETEDGENVYYMYNSKKTTITGKEAVDSWYSEIENYDFTKCGKKGKDSVGHFTQVVWKDSKELGVGVASDGNTSFVVAQYRPAGNFLNSYKENVLPKD